MTEPECEWTRMWAIYSEREPECERARVRENQSVSEPEGERLRMWVNQSVSEVECERSVVVLLVCTKYIYIYIHCTRCILQSVAKIMKLKFETAIAIH